MSSCGGFSSLLLLADPNIPLPSHCTTNTQNSPCPLEQICVKQNPPVTSTGWLNLICRATAGQNSVIVLWIIWGVWALQQSTGASVLPRGAGAIGDIGSWGHSYCGLTHQPHKLTVISHPCPGNPSLLWIRPQRKKRRMHKKKKKSKAGKGELGEKGEMRSQVFLLHTLNKQRK